MPGLVSQANECSTQMSYNITSILKIVEIFLSTLKMKSKLLLWHVRQNNINHKYVTTHIFMPFLQESINFKHTVLMFVLSAYKAYP